MPILCCITSFRYKWAESTKIMYHAIPQWQRWPDELWSFNSTWWWILLVSCKEVSMLLSAYNFQLKLLCIFFHLMFVFIFQILNKIFNLVRWKKKLWKSSLVSTMYFCCYRGGTFLFSFQVSPIYPHEAPKVKCKTKVGWSWLSFLL